MTKKIKRFGITLMLLLSGVYLNAQTVVNFTADNTTNFGNPERGFHTTTNPQNTTGTGNATWETQTASWTKILNETQVTNDRINYGVTLHSMRYHLSSFRTSPLSQAFLNQITADFAAARRAGIKLIVRFVYTWVGCTADASSSRIIGHLSQLKPILVANKDVLAWVDAGLIGCWGEWHDSQNGLLSGTYGDDVNSLSRLILDSLFKTVPSNRMILMRYPRQKSQYFHPTAPDAWSDATPMPAQSEAYNGTNVSRMGNHNDVFRGEDYVTSFGAYGWNAATYAINKTRVQTENLSVIQSGEMDKGYGNTTTLIDCTNSKADLKSFHWTAFNMNDDGGSNSAEAYTTSTLTTWRTNGCVDEIARNLGYRLQLVSATLPTSVSTGNALSGSFVIKNVGYASVMNPRNLELVLKNTSTSAETHIALSNDPRTWKSDGTYTVNFNWTVPANFFSGNYSMFLNLPDPESAISTRPEYSIRLANQNTWEATTGYNSLLNTIAITGGSSDTQAPTVPAGLGSSAITVNSFTLSWTASTDNVGVSSYDVYKDGTLYGNTISTSLAISGLLASTGYSMTVKAKDASNNVSSASTALVVTTLADTQAPTVPTGLASASETTTDFTLLWSASTDNVGVSSYDVYKDGTLYGNSTSTSLAILGLSASTTYSMTVRAKDAANNISAFSSTLNVTTNAPTNLALNKTTAYSTRSSKTFTSAKAVDGSTSTQWRSNSEVNPWIYIDLGSNYNISQVKLTWSTYYATAYNIQTSVDASTWNTISTLTSQDGGVDVNTGLSGSGRYIRIYVTSRSNSSFGVYLSEVEVYGSASLKSPAVKTSIINPSTDDNSIIIFPNPSKISFTVSNLIDDTSVSVVGIDGKIIARQKAQNGSTIFNVSMWQKGIYFICIPTENKLIVKKAIID